MKSNQYLCDRLDTPLRWTLSTEAPGTIDTGHVLASFISERGFIRMPLEMVVAPAER